MEAEPPGWRRGEFDRPKGGLTWTETTGKRLVYGLVLALHAVSTFSAFRQYLDPFSNLLFFAAWPMLAACFALYYLRDLDTLWTVDGGTRAP